MKTNELDTIIKNSFTHNLCGHPLLEFDKIKKLALRHPLIRFNHSKLRYSRQRLFSFISRAIKNFISGITKTKRSSHQKKMSTSTASAI